MPRPPKKIADKRVQTENVTFPLLVMVRVEMPTIIDLLENIRQRHPHLAEPLETVITDVTNWRAEIESKTIPALRKG